MAMTLIVVTYHGNFPMSKLIKLDILNMFSSLYIISYASIKLFIEFCIVKFIPCAVEMHRVVYLSSK